MLDIKIGKGCRPAAPMQGPLACIRSRAKLWSGTSCKRPGAAGKRAPGSQTVPAGATQRRGQHQTSPRLPQLRPWTHRHLELPASARPDVTAPQQPPLRQRPSRRRQLSLHRQRRRGPPAASRPPAYHLRRSLVRLLGLSNRVPRPGVIASAGPGSAPCLCRCPDAQPCSSFY